MIGLLWAEKSRLKWGGGVMMEMLIMVAPNLKNWLKSSTWAMTTMEVSGGLWTSFCWTNVYGKDIWAQVAHFWPEWWISLLVMVSEMLCAVHPSLNFIQLTFSGIRNLDHHRWNSLLVTVFDVDGKEGGAKDDATGGGDAEDRVDCRLNPRLFHLPISICWCSPKNGWSESILSNVDSGWPEVSRISLDPSYRSLGNFPEKKLFFFGRLPSPELVDPPVSSDLPDSPESPVSGQLKRVECITTLLGILFFY